MRDVDHVARQGGEEFVALLPGATLDDAAGAAERVRAAVERLVPQWQGRPLALTVSIGVAHWRGDGDDAAALLARADAALYRAEARGRNCVEREEAPAAAPAAPVRGVSPARR